MIENQITIGPEDFTGVGGQAGGAHRAEMDVDPARLEDRRRRGIAVLRIEIGRLVDVKHLDVVNEPAAVEIDA